jgi:hypothetical protein
MHIIINKIFVNENFLFTKFIYNTLFFLFVSLLIFNINSDNILFQSDMYHILLNSLKQLKYGTNFGITGNNLVYGNLDYGINARLIPPLWVTQFFSINFVTTIFFAASSLSYFIATFFICKSISIRNTLCFVVAWIVCLCLFPVFKGGMLYGMYVELMVVVTPLYFFSALFLINTGLLIRITKNSAFSKSIILVVINFIIFSYIIIAYTQYSIVYFYLASFMLFGVLISSNSIKIFLNNLFYILLTGILLIFLFKNYLINYYESNWSDIIFENKRNLIFLELINAKLAMLVQGRYFDFIFDNWHLFKYSYNNYRSLNWLGPIPAFGSVFFAIIVFFYNLKTKSINKNYITFLNIYFILIIGYWLWGWGYLEVILSPFIVINFALFILFIFTYFSSLKIASISEKNKKMILIFSSLVLIMPTAIYCKLFNYSNRDVFIIKDINDSNIYKYVTKNLSIKHDNQFKGRLAAITFRRDLYGDKENLLANLFDDFDTDFTYTNKNHSNFRFTPIIDEVPIIYDINRFISVPSISQMNYLLSNPNDIRQDQSFYPSKPSVKWFQIYGIRYLVTTEKSNLFKPLIVEHFPNITLYLYEISDVNLGTYTPTNQIIVDSIADSLFAMDGHNFNPKQSFTTMAEQLGALTPAYESTLNVNGNEIQIKSKSNSKSLLVIPFEYSNCLKVKSSSNDFFKIINVNASQIGVYFKNNLDIKIKIDFSPSSYSCKRDDISLFRQSGAADLKIYQGMKIKGGKI